MSLKTPPDGIPNKGSRTSTRGEISFLVFSEEIRREIETLQGKKFFNRVENMAFQLYRTRSMRQNRDVGFLKTANWS